MKTLATTILCVALATGTATAQTVNVNVGEVNTAFTATTDEMTFTQSGQQLSIGGVTYGVADIDSIIVGDNSVADNTIDVVYNGDAARVTVAGNIAPYITVTANGSHVAIAQAESLPSEVTYTLSGASTDGSFYMSGKLKASIVFNGLSLACADSAAVNIQNGKRISVELADGTTNTLSDGANGDQKACFMVKGHTEFKGGGQLNIVGNAKHAFWGGEYVELKKTTGTINITAAKKDGMNINQYFLQKGGTLDISGTGDDGIQVSTTDDSTDEQNGQALISGGQLTISVTATAAKGLKCDSTLTISGGTILITTSGGGEYDSDDKDVSASSAIKADGNAIISGGDITLKSTGAGGKGLSCDGDIDISGGSISVTTTGKQYVYGSLDALPKGIKADGNMTISGGYIDVTTTGGEGAEGLESKATMSIEGGEIVVNTYDDALNASSHIGISGGKIYAVSTNNDAIDSNGTLTVSGGLVIACGTEAPEGGFDCDQNTFTITGGTIIGMGGDTSTPTTSTTTQPVMILGGSSYTSGQYLTLCKSGESNAIIAFKVPTTYREAKVMLSDAELATGNTYTVSKGATVTTESEWHGYSADATISGGSTVASLTLNSTVTQQGGGGGQPGGGGGQPGGGGGQPGGGHGGGGWH